MRDGGMQLGKELHEWGIQHRNLGEGAVRAAGRLQGGCGASSQEAVSILRYRSGAVRSKAFAQAGSP